jgi:plasmid stabilization system protein ParE
MTRSNVGSTCDEDHLVAAVAARRRVHPDHIAQDSPQIADLVVRRIIKAIERLESFPESGRKVRERNDPEIREVIAAPYRVVYRLREGNVEIITVFRATRLFPWIR